MMQFSDLDCHEELFLLSIGEPFDNQLRLILSEGGIIQEEPEELVGDASTYQLISAREGAAFYEVLFKSYVAYSVRNESFTMRDDEEVWAGRLCCLYERSKFLDYVRLSTIGRDEERPIIHFGINCANHVVDVATVAPPHVRRLPSRVHTPAGLPAPHVE